MLQLKPQYEIVAEAHDALTAIEQTLLHTPDIVLMDIQMPGRLNGIGATQQIKKTNPEIPVLMLTSHDNKEYVLDALRAGAAGYLLKEATIDQFHNTITSVLDGGCAIDNELANRLLRKIADEERSDSNSPHTVTPIYQPHQNPRTQPAYTLSQRECQILTHVADGLTNQDIATLLHLSPHTIKGHVANIIDRLHVSDRTQAAVKAVRLGIIKDDQEEAS